MSFHGYYFCHDCSGNNVPMHAYKDKVIYFCLFVVILMFMVANTRSIFC